MHIICTAAKFQSKDTFTENSKGFKKQNYCLGHLMNFFLKVVTIHTA